MADQFQAAPGADDPCQQIGEFQAGTFNARRHDAGGDYRRLQQAEIIAGKIKHLGEAGDIRGGAKVHAGQAQNGFVNHAQARLHRRLRGLVAAVNTEVNGHVEHARAFGEIHAQEKNVAPARVAQIHAHRREFAQHGIQAVLAPVQQFRPHAQRMILGMAHAEHPLVAAHGAHAAAHLVRERLEADALIHRGQRAGNRVARAGDFLNGKKLFQRLLKPALEQMLKALEGNHPVRARRQFPGEMKAVDRVKEEQRADALVKIFAAPAEGVQFRARGQQFVRRGAGANGVERLVADFRIRRGDDVDERAGHARDQ